ncbi:hypothetical protein GGF46_003105 [Coemansia sp. RSA 552]|nr:hypothetical protein GGF46_003105 [Coemansia sp. RSA 552]
MAGLPYWEPGFGTVEPVAEGVVGGDKSDSGGQGLVVSKAAPLLPNTGPVLHCVAFLITHEELEHIIRTEGGGGNADMGYQQLKVRCVAYDGTSLLGVTLIDIEPSTVNLHPSLRYMGLLIEGAIEHGIAPDYVKMLQSVKPYVAKTAGQKVAKYLMVCLFLPLMLPMLAFGFAAVVFGSDIPRVIAAYNERVKSLMWYTHSAPPPPPLGSRSGGTGRYAQIVIKEPNTSEPKKAKRKRITPEQLKELTAVFEKTDTPTHDIREELSKKLNMTNREVQVWFQNRRAKYNRMRIEQQRQLRANTEILYRSGLMPSVRMSMSMPMPMPMSAPMPVSGIAHARQIPPQMAYARPHALVPCQLQQNLPLPPHPTDAYMASSPPSDMCSPRHAMLSSATPQTPNATYQPYHPPPRQSAQYHNINSANTPCPGAAPLPYGPVPESPTAEWTRSPGGDTCYASSAYMPLGRRNTVSSYRGAGPANNGDADVHGRPPLYRQDPALATCAASARSRYVHAIPRSNQRHSLGRRVNGGSLSPQIHHRNSDPAQVPQYPATPSHDGSPIRLPSIHDMLAGISSTGDSERPAARARAYTSPPQPPPPLDPCRTAPIGPGASAADEAETSPTAHRAQDAGSPTRSSASRGACSSPDMRPSSSGGQHHAEARANDTKLGIEVLAAAAISVSSAKSSGSLPHLTPLSEFSFRASPQRFCPASAVPGSPRPAHGLQQRAPLNDGSRRSGIQSRKITPVDNGHSWRPW